MPQVVGLDIGSRSVKAVLFERGFRGLELSSFHKADFDPADAEGLSRALREIVSHLSPSATVVTRLPGDRVLLRFLDMPITDARKLDAVIPFEVESLIPYELEDLILDHAVVRRNADGGSRVMVAAARRDDVRLSLEQLAASGIEPRFIAAGPTALGALVTAAPALGQGVIALVDAGFSRTDVCLLSEGKVTFVRTISGGMADLANAHVSMGGSLDDLERLDIAATDVRGAGSRAAAEFVAKEIRRTLMAAEMETGLVPGKLVLFGGLAKLRGFAALVERTSHVLVEPIALAGAEWAKNGLTQSMETEAAVSVALAFRVVADPSVAGVNFRRDEFSWKRDVKELSGILTRAVVMGLILALLAGINYGVKERLLAGEKKKLDKAIAEEVLAAFPDAPKDRLKDGDAAVSIMRGNVDEATQRLSALGGGGVSAIDVLRAISDVTPAGMYIDVKEYELSESKVRMKCVLDSYEASDKLVAALKTVKLFANVDTRDAGNEAGTSKRRVTIVMDVVAPAGGES